MREVPPPGPPSCSALVATCDGDRTLRPIPNRSFFTSSMRRSSALSMIAGKSSSGTRCDNRSRACCSLSRRARLAVNCTLNVSPLSGATTARWFITTDCGAAAERSSTLGDAGSAREAAKAPGGPATAGSVRSAAGADMGAHLTMGLSGSLRMITGTGGSGARRATSSSISRFDFPAASARTSSWFPSVRCGASSRSPARCTCPDLAASTTAGIRRPTRATVIRL